MKCNACGGSGKRPLEVGKAYREFTANWLERQRKAR